MIYVSTGGYKDISFQDAIKILSKENIYAFELSGGVYSKTIKEDLESHGTRGRPWKMLKAVMPPQAKISLKNGGVRKHQVQRGR